MLTTILVCKKVLILGDMGDEDFMASTSDFLQFAQSIVISSSAYNEAGPG